MIRRPPLSANTFLVFATLIVAGLGISRIQAFDTFWQLQSGKYILETGDFIYTDIFSLAADVYRHEHCWLHDIILYLVYEIGGYGGISILKGGLIAATFGFLVAAARSRKASVTAILLISLPAFLNTAWVWRARPQLWTFLFFAIFVWVLERHRRKGDAFIFVLFPLMLLWVNLHAGSILAVPVLAAYLVGSAFDRLRVRSPGHRGGIVKLCILFLLGLVSMIATPYGYKLLEVLNASPDMGPGVGITGRFNIDWQVTTLGSFPDFYMTSGGAVALLVLGRRKICFSDLFLLGGLAIMGYKLARHTPFFFFAVAAILPLYADVALEPLRKVLSKSRFKWVKVVAGVAAGAWILVFLQEGYYRQGLFQTGLKEWYYPRNAVSFLKQHRLPGNLFHSYEWGGYLMWELYPEYLVFWDGRQGSPKMYGLGLKVQDGEEGWQTILDSYDVNTILVKPLSVDIGARFRILDRLRESARWELVYSDDHSLIFVRAGAVDPEWLARYRQPKERIDQVLLSEGVLMLNEYGTNRYRVYWEAFRIFFSRQEYDKAFQNLEQFRAKAPEQERETEIVRYYYSYLQKALGR